MKTSIDITVRASGGTYMTNRVNKLQASCTSGPEHAAKRLGVKLFGASLDRVESLGDGSRYGITKWRLHATEVRL